MRLRTLGLVILVGALAGCHDSDSGASGGQSTSSKGKGKSAAPAAERSSGGGLLAALRREKPVLPEGTTLPVELDTALSSGTSRSGDPVVGRLAEDVRIGDKVVLREGTELRGKVTTAMPSGRVKGRARLAFDFDTLVYDGRSHEIDARAVDVTAPSARKRNAELVGGGAVGGAIVGALVGGKKGAGIGALVGAGAGTGVVLTHKGAEVQIPAGSRVRVKLNRDVQLG